MIIVTTNSTKSMIFVKNIIIRVFSFVFLASCGDDRWVKSNRSGR